MTPERWRQVEDLYHAAGERMPAERAAAIGIPAVRREARWIPVNETIGTGVSFKKRAAGKNATPRKRKKDSE